MTSEVTPELCRCRIRMADLAVLWQVCRETLMSALADLEQLYARLKTTQHSNESSTRICSLRGRPHCRV